MTFNCTVPVRSFTVPKTFIHKLLTKIFAILQVVSVPLLTSRISLFTGYVLVISIYDETCEGFCTMSYRTFITFIPFIIYNLFIAFVCFHCAASFNL